MSLLNPFTKKNIGKEIHLDVEKRIKIWEEYLNSYIKKYKLAKGLLNSTNPIELVQEIETFIPRELVDIERERKNEKELLRDLIKITSNTWSNQVHDLKGVIKEEKDSRSIIEILKRLSELLKIQLHTIEKIKQKPENIKNYLDHLYKLIVTVEFNLNSLFRDMLEREELKDIRELVYKIIRGERIAQEIESEEQKLYKVFRRIMGEESSHDLRQLAHIIYEELLNMVDFANDMSAGQKLHRLVNNDEVLINIIRKYHPRYSEKKIKAIVRAFRYVFEHGHIP